MNCTWEETAREDGKFHCQQVICAGKCTNRTAHRRCDASTEVIEGPASLPLGDAVEGFLTSYGITKEWYRGFKEKFGLPPTCNCEARKQWLNKTSDAHPTIANIGVELLSFLTRKTP